MLHISTTPVAPPEAEHFSSADETPGLYNLCCSTTLELLQFILSPDQFDNTDYFQKQSLEVHSPIRDFANALHPNNLLHQGGVGANSIGFHPAHEKTISTIGLSLPFQGQNMVFLSVERLPGGMKATCELTFQVLKRLLHYYSFLWRHFSNKLTCV